MGPNTDFEVVTGSIDAGAHDSGLAANEAGPMFDAAMPLDAAARPRDAMASADAAAPADAGEPPADAMIANAAGATGGAGAGGQNSGGAGRMSPSSTGRIVLGGVPIDKEDVLAFIEIGHSNMEGRGTDPAGLRAYNFTETDPHGWMYRVGSAPAPVREPFTGCSLPMSDCLMTGGPGTPLIKQAIELAPEKYFLSLGTGRNYAYCSQFLPGALYWDDVTKAAIAVKDVVTFAGIVVMLGISEHGSEIANPQTGLVACITQLIAAVRNAVGQPDLPVLFCDYEMGATGDLAPGGPFANVVIPELHKLPGLIQRSAIVPTDDLPMQDDHHFNLEGHKIWTKRVLDTMLEKGWFPWAKSKR